jgi:hypothetical protein
MDTMGQQLIVGNRSDGFSVMVPIVGQSPERLRKHLDSYLDDDCICDSNEVQVQCGVHREASVV